MGIRIKQANELNPDVSEELNEWILVATEQEPDDRFPDAETMLLELAKDALGKTETSKSSVETTNSAEPDDGEKEPKSRLPSESVAAVIKPLIVICEGCGKKYKIDASKVGEKGARFICKICKKIVDVSRDEVMAPLAPAKTNVATARRKHPKYSLRSEHATGSKEEQGKKNNSEMGSDSNKCIPAVTKQKPPKETSPVLVGIKRPEYRLRKEPKTVFFRVYKTFNLNTYQQPTSYIQNKYEDALDGTVIDYATGLVWQKANSVKDYDFKEAEGYIGELNRSRFAGFCDWRLPTVDELVSLLEPERKSILNKFIDPVFDDRRLDEIWTSDRHGFGEVFRVLFNHCKITWKETDIKADVKAVRSMRSIS